MGCQAKLIGIELHAMSVSVVQFEQCHELIEQLLVAIHPVITLHFLLLPEGVHQRDDGIGKGPYQSTDYLRRLSTQSFNAVTQQYIVRFQRDNLGMGKLTNSFLTDVKIEIRMVLEVYFKLVQEVGRDKYGVSIVRLQSISPLMQTKIVMASMRQGDLNSSTSTRLVTMRLLR